VSPAAFFLVPTASGPVDAVVTVPGSKSIANRALVCAALAEGESRILGCAPGDDTVAMLGGLATLGIPTDPLPADPDPVVVLTGTGGRLAPGPLTVHAHLAGTTSRFLTAVAALGPGPFVIDGDPPLRRRPMAPLHEALAALGASVTALDAPGTLPVEVTGRASGGSIAMRGDVSSQYVTALMLVAPLLREGLDLELTTELVSRPYVEITAAVMAAFGHDRVRVEDARVRVQPGGYRPTRYRVEPDASSASYPLAVAAVAGGSVTVPGLGDRPLQGDARFADLLGMMGCTVERGADGVRVSRSVEVPLRGLDVDLADVSDLVPTVAAVAALASTPSRIRGVGFIRGKESDRLGDLARELRRLGALVDETEDGLEIRPAALHGGRVTTHHDHRLAMAFGVIGAVVPGVEVEEPGVVSKSWPDFWRVLVDLVGGGPVADQSSSR
jgi:3-phosphoshikimate 1-carboxyvinyltransferase